jgi:hypothetical protein
MKREDVYKIIDTERDYQESKENQYGYNKNKTVGEWIVLMNHYTTELNKAFSNYTGDYEALNVMRKLAGIAVHCMEQHNAPERKI